MTLQDIIEDVRERYNLRPTGSAPLRPIPANLVRPPRYRYPSERGKLPTVCGHCGKRLIPGDLPTAEHPVADLVCLLCSRTACELVYDATRPIPPTTPPAITRCERCETQPAAPHRRHCWGCAARIRAERLNAAPLPPCADCGQRPRTVKHARCNSCRHRIYASRTGALR